MVSDTEPALVFVGGGIVVTGTLAEPPPKYRSALFALLRSVADESWQRWWSASGQPRCELYAYMGGPRTGVRMRRTESKVTAHIERAVAWGAPDPGLAAAAADVEALIGALRGRFDLPDPPELHTFTRSEITRWT